MGSLRRLAKSSLLRVIATRLLQAIPVIIGVSLITYALMSLLPGSQAQALLGQQATHAQVAALNQQLHLNEPFFERYWGWLSGALTGHLGTSLATDQPVASVLAQRLPVTVELIVLAFAFAFVLAVVAALVGSRKPAGVADRLNMAVSMIGLSVPNFVVALVLILIFAVHVGILPPNGFVPLSQGVTANLRTMLLPSLSLALGLFGTYNRVLSADMREQLERADYVLAARGRGVSTWRILVSHVLRNAAFGLVTLVALNLGTLIGGTVISEEIFSLPGIGQYLLQSITGRDVVSVEAVAVIAAVAVVVVNLVADVLYSVLDPRIRHGATAGR